MPLSQRRQAARGGAHWPGRLPDPDEPGFAVLLHFAVLPCLRLAGAAGRATGNRQRLSVGTDLAKALGTVDDRPAQAQGFLRLGYDGSPFGAAAACGAVDSASLAAGSSAHPRRVAHPHVYAYLPTAAVHAHACYADERVLRRAVSAPLLEAIRISGQTWTSYSGRQASGLCSTVEPVPISDIRWDPLSPAPGPGTSSVR